MLSLAVAAAEAVPVRVDLSSGSATVVGTLAPGAGIDYLLLPAKGQGELHAVIESVPETAGFTVWDSANRKAEPLPGLHRRLLPGVDVPEGGVYVPNLEWRGGVQPREHRIMVSNEGTRPATYRLTLRLQYY